MLQQATGCRDTLFARRDKSVAELAKEHGMAQSHFVRLVRLNYLAPDIQAAILDGTQPPRLTRRRLMDAAMVLDWKQQRDLLNFVDR